MNSSFIPPNACYLVTGAAGFIGYYFSARLLAQGHRVIGLDSLNAYYDVQLKHDRLAKLQSYENFTFTKQDLCDEEALMTLFEAYKPDVVVHLAAQAGVRYSITNPHDYMSSNMMGFFHVLEACRRYKVAHLLYASSSSVYGANQKVPFSEDDPVDHPVSLYAATKKSNELMAHTYSHLYDVPTSGLRFFTVYGPMGRPDMAYFQFVQKYFASEAIAIYNNGDFEHDLYRDFTYIDDIVEGMERLVHHCPGNAADVPHAVYNIGNNQPEKLMTFIETLESALSNTLGHPVTFLKNFEPIKPGDVPATYADVTKLQQAVGFQPKTSIADGLQAFVDWYVDYYKIVQPKPVG
ncbi:nucleotide sugar epimerase [Fictibacillus macauensis ZFHKF-1]|uniref:Nucleotide sugar epimerase n=1 Tax=Fictibacillus macauensis ZFHKF-1 TaxID=1196324 RepID=I8UAR0_9BACL|nr:GDP-mannose 4,6-dehydratase [Fictibacillus macauensis]EIT84000.1 nucleotide sugar epimerase [Fictibacillus macauensis ZFHKF-1]